MRRQIVAWYLFAFASSALVFNGGLYFPQWLVVDNHVRDIWYNASLVLTTVTLLLSAPALGGLSDRRYGRLLFLRLLSASMFVGTAGLYVVDQFFRNHEARAAIALALFVLVLYSYQLSLVFHNALLARIASASEYAEVSGRGVAWGLAGAIVGILTVLPFVNGSVPYVLSGRAGAFLPSAIFFGLLALPSVILMPDDRPQRRVDSEESVAKVYHSLTRGLRALPANWQLYNFLLAYLVYMDVILTIEDNSSIYLEKVMRFSDNEKAALYLLLLIAGTVGGIVSAYIMRKVSPNTFLLCTLGGFCIVLAVIVISGSQLVFCVMFGIVGFLFGGLLNVSRVIYLLLVPVEKRGEMFGIYASFERSASVLGPLMWSAPITLLPGLGIARYRVAMLVMLSLIASSTVFVARMRRAVA